MSIPRAGFRKYADTMDAQRFRIGIPRQNPAWWVLNTSNIK